MRSFFLIDPAGNLAQLLHLRPEKEDKNQGTRGAVTPNANGTVTYSPNANTSGVDAFTYTIRDAAGLTSTATVTVNVASVNDPPVAGNDSATVNEGGSVVINVLANDTDIEGNTLTVSSVSTPPHGTATRNADNTITYVPASTRITIAATAAVASDVYSNQLTNGGTISGAQYTPLALPVFATLPAFQTGTPNTTDVNVATNGNRTLAPGTYRDLTVGKKGTVTMTGGVYVFRSIQLGSEAKLFFSAPSTVKVQQKVSAANLSQIKPGTGSTATAATIVLHVAGSNGTGGGLAETPKAVEIGTDSTVSANLYVPNGTLWLKDRTVATGAFIARDIQANPDVQVSLSSGW